MGTVKHLLASLAIVDENIRREAQRQPLLFIQAARWRVRKFKERAQAELAVEAFASQYVLSLRAKKAGRKERVVEGYYKGRLQQNVHYRRLRAAVSVAEAAEEFSKLLLEAFRQRMSALKIIDNAQSYEAGREVVDLERDRQNKRLKQRARALYRHRSVEETD